MKNLWKILCPIAILLVVAALSGQTPKAKRLNRIIDILEQGQPVYYDSSHDGIAGGGELGKKDAQTWADYIVYDMEHAPWDIEALTQYMRGLAAGGPTRTGHRMPPVLVVVPVSGTDEATVRANAWQIQQALATGVHGILLAHADTPGAVRAFVEAARFPVHKQGVGQQGLQEGRRGVHGVPIAAKIWGVSEQEYIAKADPWPLNPNGELLIGVKMENRRAAERCVETARVPGLAFGEWGLGDMALSFGYAEKPSFPLPAELEAVRTRIWDACKDAGLYFLGIVTPETVTTMIDRGMKLCRAYDPAAVEIGRKYTKLEGYY